MDGRSAKDMTGNPESAHSSASRDSGYSSISSDSATSNRHDEHNKHTRPPPARVYREPAPYAQPSGMDSAQDREQTHVEQICRDQYCVDAGCLRRREALYQYHHPQVHFPPPSGNDQTRPPNPFMPLFNLAHGRRDHEYQPPFAQMHPPGPPLGHSFNVNSVPRENWAPPYPMGNPNNVAYHDAYLDRYTMPEYVPTIPYHTRPPYMHDHQDDFARRQGVRQVSYPHIGPESYQQQLEYEYRTAMPHHLPASAPTHRPREAQRGPRKSTHKHLDTLVEQDEAKVRKPSRGLALKPKNTRSGRGSLHGGRDTQDSKEFADKTALTPDNGTRFSVDSAAADLAVSPTRSTSHDRVTTPDVAATPQKENHSDHSETYTAGQMAATDGAADTTQANTDRLVVRDPSACPGNLTEDLPPPYQIAEVGAEPNEEAVSELVTMPLHRKPDFDDKNRNPDQAKEVSGNCALGVSPPSLHSAEKDPLERATLNPSTSSVTLQQEPEVSEENIEPPDNTSCGGELPPDTVDGLATKMSQKDNDQTYRQIKIVARFSDAIIQRCRSIDASTTTDSTGLRTSTVALLDIYSLIVLASATSDDERFAAQSVSQHGR